MWKRFNKQSSQNHESTDNTIDYTGAPSYATTDTLAFMPIQQGSENRSSNSPQRSRGNTDDRGALGNILSNIRSSSRAISDQISESFVLADVEIERKVSQAAGRLGKEIQHIITAAKAGGQMNRPSDERRSKDSSDFDSDAWKTRLLQILGGTDVDVELADNPYATSDVDILLQNSNCEKFILRCIESELPPNLIHCLRLLRVLELQAAHSYARLQRNTKSTTKMTTNSVSTSATQKVMQLLILLCKDVSVGEQLRPHLFGLLALPGASYPPNGMHIARAAADIVVAFSQFCLSPSLAMFLHERKAVMNMTDDVKELCGLIESTNVTSGSLCLYGQDAEMVGLWVVGLRAIVYIVHSSCAQQYVQLLKDFYDAGGYDLLTFAIWNSTSSNVKKLLELVATLTYCKLDTGITRDNSSSNFFGDFAKSPPTGKSSSEYGLASNPGAFQLIDNLMVRSVPFLKKYGEIYNGAKVSLQTVPIKDLAQTSLEISTELLMLSKNDSSDVSGVSRMNSLASELLVSTLQLYSDHPRNYVIIEENYHVLALYLISFPSFSDVSTKVVILKTLEYVCTGLFDVNPVIPLQITCVMLLAISKYRLRLCVDENSIKNHEELLNVLYTDSSMLLDVLEKLALESSSVPDALNDVGIFDDHFDELSKIVMSSLSQEQQSIQGVTVPPARTAFDEPFVTICRLLNISLQSNKKIEKESRILLEASLTLSGQSRDLNLLINTGVCEMGMIAAEAALATLGTKMTNYTSFAQLQIDMHFLIQLSIYFSDLIVKLSSVDSYEDIDLRILLSRQIIILRTLSSVLATNRDSIHSFRIGSGFDIIDRALSSLTRYVHKLNYSFYGSGTSSEAVETALKLTGQCLDLLKVALSLKDCIAEGDSPDDHMGPSLDQIVYFERVADSIAAAGLLAHRSTGKYVVNCILQVVEPSLQIVMDIPETQTPTSPGFLMNPDAIPFVVGVAVRMTADIDLSCDVIQTIYNLCLEETSLIYCQISANKTCRKLMASKTFLRVLENPDHPLFKHLRQLFKRISMMKMTYEEFMWLVRRMIDPLFLLEEERTSHSKGKVKLNIIDNDGPDASNILELKLRSNLEYLTQIAEEESRYAAIRLGGNSLNSIAYEIQKGKLEERLQWLAKEGGTRFIQLETTEQGQTSSQNILSPQALAGNLAVAENLWSATANNGFSFSVWIRIPYHTYSEGNVFLLDISSAPDDDSIRLLLRPHHDYLSLFYDVKKECFNIITSSTPRPTSFSRMPLLAGTWHHICFMYQPPKRTVLTRRALVGLTVNGKAVDMDVKIDPILLPTKSRIYIGVPNPVLIISGIVNGLLLDWDMGSCILFSTAVSARNATAIYLLGPNFEGSFWGDRPQRLSLTSCATVNIANFAHDDGTGGVLKVLEECGVSDFESSSHSSMENRFLGAYYEDSLSTMGLLFQVSPDSVMASFRLSAHRVTNSQELCLSNLARINSSDSVTTDATVFGVNHINIPQTFADNVRWAGGPSIFFPLVHLSKSLETLVLSLRLIRSCIYRHTPNTDSMQSGGGYRVLAHLLREKNIKDHRVIDECFGLATNMSLSKINVELIEKHARPLVLVDLDAMKTILLNQHLWDLQDGPSVPLHLNARLSLLIVPNGTNSPFNARRLHQLGIVSFMLNMMLEAAKMYNLGYIGAEEMKKLEPKNQHVSAITALKNGWYVTPPSSVAVSAGGDPGNPLLFSCKSLLRRVLTYMLTPMDLEAIATSVIYTLSIDNSSMVSDSSEDEVGIDYKLLPGSVTRIYLIRILEELIVERIDVKVGQENIEAARTEQTRSFLSAFSGILRPSWFMSLLDRSRDEASTSAIFRLLVLLLQTCKSFLQTFIQEEGFKTLIITIPKLSTSPAVILNIFGLLLHAPIWHIPCFATLYASQLRDVFESEWDNVELIKNESFNGDATGPIPRGAFSLLLECVVRNIRLSELNDTLGHTASNINDVVLNVLEVCLKRSAGFKDFSRTIGILEPLSHTLCESIRAKNRRGVTSRKNRTDSYTDSILDHVGNVDLVPFQGELESELRIVHIMRMVITDLMTSKPAAAVMVHAWFRSYPPHASIDEIKKFHSLLIECCALAIQGCLVNGNHIIFSNAIGLCSVFLERLLSGLFECEDIFRCAVISSAVLQNILSNMRATATITNDMNGLMGDALHINRLINLAALQRFRLNGNSDSYQLQIDLLNLIHSNLASLLTIAPILFHTTSSKKLPADSLTYQLLQSASIVRTRISTINVSYPDIQSVEDPERSFILVLLVELNFLLRDKGCNIRESALLVIIKLLRERRSVMAELMKKDIRKGENRTETIDLINRGGFGALLAVIDSPMNPIDNAAPQLMNAAFFDWMDRNQNQVTPIFDSIRAEAYSRMPIFDGTQFQSTALAIESEQKSLSDLQNQRDENDFIMKGTERSKYLQQIHDQCSENLVVWKRLGFSDVICGGFLWQKSSVQMKGDFSFGSMYWLPQLRTEGDCNVSIAPEIERLTLDLSEGYERQRRRLIPNYKFEVLYNILDNESPNSLSIDSKETSSDACSDAEGDICQPVDYSVDTLLQATAAMLKASKVHKNDTDIESDSDFEPDEDQELVQSMALKQGSTMQNATDLTDILSSDNATAENREVVAPESETNQDDGNLIDGKEIIASSLDLVMGFLIDGDRPEKVYNVKRCIGLEVRKAILLWCSRAIYIIDGFEKMDGDGEGLLGRINRVEQYVTTFSISLRSNKEENNDALTTPVNGDVTCDTTASKKKTQKSEEAIFRHRSQRISFDDIHCIYRRRYQLRQNALEFYDINKTGILVAFDNQAKREEVLMSTFNARLPNSIFNSRDFGSTLALGYNKFMNNYRTKVTNDWVHGKISNFEFIMNLNTFAGRSYNDLTQYPVFPWIITDYESENIDLNDPSIYRDLSKPMGAIGEARAKQFKDRYDALEMHYLDEEGEHEQPPPFHYGTHYSCAAYVVNYLIRLEPFSRLALTLQGGKFDLADRLFHNVAASWRSASRDNLQDVRELIPEFFYLPDFLLNKNSFDYGVTQHGKVVHHVTLPPWARGDPGRFVRIQRKALESDYVSRNLHKWVDLIFGCKQRGREAIEALNTFVHVTYEGAVDLDTIEDPVVRESTLAQINNFGQTPTRLEKTPYPSRNTASILKDKTIDLNALVHVSHLTPSFCIAGAPHKVYMKSNAWESCKVGLERQDGPGVGDVYSSKGSILGVGANCIFLNASTYLRYDGRNNGISFHVASVSNRYREVDKVLSIIDDMHSAPLTLARISLDSHFLLTTCSDATVRVWRVKTNARSNEKNHTLRLLGTLSGHEGVRVTCMDICTIFGSVVTGDARGVILLWNLRTLGFLRKLTTDEGRSPTKSHEPTVSVSLNRKNGNIVTLVGSSLKIFDINGNPVATLPSDFKFPMNNMPTCAAATNCQEWMDGIVAVTGHVNGDVRMWSIDYERGLLVFRHVIPDKVHDSSITCLRCLDSQKTLLIGDSSGRISMANTLQLDSLSVSELAVVAEELRMLSDVAVR